MSVVLSDGRKRPRWTRPIVYITTVHNNGNPETRKAVSYGTQGKLMPATLIVCIYSFQEFDHTVWYGNFDIYFSLFSVFFIPSLFYFGIFFSVQLSLPLVAFPLIFIHARMTRSHACAQLRIQLCVCTTYVLGRRTWVRCTLYVLNLCSPSFTFSEFPLTERPNIIH